MKLRKSKNKQLIKLATKFKPWDYVFNLEMEKAMFERMYKYFSDKDALVTGSKRVAREIKLSISLLSIILEYDNAVVWYDRCEWKLVKYVNIKNIDRFWKNPPKINEIDIKECLRQRKAWYLYNKLRYYRMKYWWN